ncbi:MAG: transcription elongation factor GreA [Bacteroidia bacterium]
MEITYLTQEKLDELKAQLHELKTKGRIEMALQIAEAREKGDLSENAEYDSAKDAQGLMEMKISKLETLVASSRIVDTSNMDPDKIYILSTVKIKNVKTNAVVTYTLVAEEEADLKKQKISVKSPVGASLLGKKVGDVAEVKAPAGVLQFEILEISRT